MEDQAQHEVEYQEVSLGRYALIAAVVAIVVAVGAFFAGKAAAGASGPATLADAVTQARNGKLPCGGNAAATPDAAPQAGARANPDFIVQAVCDRNGSQQNRFQPPSAGGFAFGGPTGRITSISGSTLTIQDRQESRKVTLNDSTTVRKLAGGAKGDLKTGQTVIVAGGFASHLSETDLERFSKRAKQVCGCGGTVAGREIELQGSDAARIRRFFEGEGFRVDGI
jgi:hypothetical protein